MRGSAGATSIEGQGGGNAGSGARTGLLANLRAIDWIWHIRGSIALPPGQSSDDAFARLDPLFQAPGTSTQRAGDTLTFTKKDQAAQDKMSVFDAGSLHVEAGVDGPVLRYDLASRALLFCCLAPLFFLGIAQLTIAVGKFQKPATETAAEKSAAKKPEVPMNPIDKALGAPAPEKKDKKGKKDPDKAEGGKKKPSPTPAYVFAGIFAALYLIGRLLEDWLIRRVFKQQLQVD